MPLAVTAKPLDLARPAGVSDILVARSDVLVIQASLFVAQAAAGLTSIAIRVNTATPFELLSAAGGSIALLTAEKNLLTTWPQAQPFLVPAGRRVQLTITGNGTSGLLWLRLRYALGDFY